MEAGTSVYTVQHILGHKNVATTQIYAAMADESKRESLTFEHPRQTGKRRTPSYARLNTYGAQETKGAKESPNSLAKEKARGRFCSIVQTAVVI